MHPMTASSLAILDEWTDSLGSLGLRASEELRPVPGAANRHRARPAGRGGAPRSAESPAPARAVEVLIVQRARRRRSRRRRLVAAVAALFVATAAAATIRAGGVHEILGRLTAARAPAWRPVRHPRRRPARRPPGSRSSPRAR